MKKKKTPAVYQPGRDYGNDVNLLCGVLQNICQGTLDSSHHKVLFLTVWSHTYTHTETLEGAVPKFFIVAFQARVRVSKQDFSFGLTF